MTASTARVGGTEEAYMDNFPRVGLGSDISAERKGVTEWNGRSAGIESAQNT